MNKLILMVLLLPTILVAAEDNSISAVNGEIKTVSSPHNRVAVLELYTSEGCSSCPPADRFLSQLKNSGISERQLIPMAFHVTYWDYIGWNDRFANKQYDQRQREQAHKNNSTSVYTPQFLLSGDDFRRYASFSEDVNKLIQQEPLVDLSLSAQVVTNVGAEDVIHLVLDTETSNKVSIKTGIYFVVLENNLSSDVSDGENEGEKLLHDFVVRQMYGPYYQEKGGNRNQLKQRITLKSDWKKQDLSIVVFAEDSQTGEVLQAVRLSQI